MKTKILLAGLGNFGQTWYRALLPRPDLELIVADPEPAHAARLASPKDHFFISVEDALVCEPPDLLLNLTPPAVHSLVNALAFDLHLPVLCEKPIAEDYTDAQEIVARAVRENQLFMIAENYRRHPAIRQLKKLIDEGVVGELTAIYINFAKEFYEDKAYLLAMPDPLLQDVSIHHLDCIRYLTGCEAKKVNAWSYNPRYSRFPGNAAVNIQLEMDNGLMVTYTGSLQTRANSTDWLGDWRLEGTKGVLVFNGELASFPQGRNTPQLIPLEGNQANPQEQILDEFLSAMQSGTQPETNAADYLKSQALVHHALASSRSGKTVEIH